MAATTGIYVVTGLVGLVAVFVFALMRTAKHADESYERAFAEHLRERARSLESLTGMTIAAPRAQTGEIAAVRLSRRQTWRQPSSA